MEDNLFYRCSMLSLNPLPWRSSSKCHPRHFFKSKRPQKIQKLFVFICFICEQKLQKTCVYAKIVVPLQRICAFCKKHILAICAQYKKHKLKFAGSPDDGQQFKPNVQLLHSLGHHRCFAYLTGTNDHLNELSRLFQPCCKFLSFRPLYHVE